MLFQAFDYMKWAKLEPAAGVRFNLAASGFNRLDLAQLAPDLSRIADVGPGYGSPVVKERISRRYGVPEDHILPVLGTSLGIFLAMAALLEPGDEALVERPAYEPLFKVPLSLGIPVHRFERGLEERFEVDPERVRRAMTPKTRVVALSDLHNPSGRALTADVRHALVDLAAERGATLLVDEVYRDFLGADPPETIYRPGAPVVVVSSLTKVYGMGGLRAGWIFAAPETIDRAAGIVDLLHVNDPYPLIPFIEGAFDRADEFRRTAIETARAGQAILAAWINERPELRWSPPDAGLTAFPRLPEGLTGSRVSETLKREEGTLVVPGRFFEDDRHIRIGVPAGPEVVREGLERLGRVLDRLQA